MKRYLIIIVAALMVAISLASCFRWEETTTMTTTTTTTTTWGYIYADSEKANLGYICIGEIMGFADEFDWSVWDRYQKGLKFFLPEPLG